ncbi:MAG TPA: leucyl/phenylalanyl-tRNA--protein transferase [Rubrivivax sp.]|nr:leucyl/phenylalanyl-tRNA--protein transferase [Rubrivivax sp.]
MPRWIEDTDPLPPGRSALGAESEAPGLVAVGGTLTTARLEEAYRKGIFPWFSQGQPVLWWSTNPRMVLPVAEFRVSHSLRKTLRRFAGRAGCEIRVDHACEAVIRACAQAPREGQDGTWIVPAMIEAYAQWHREGRVHSFETWIDGELVGGLYGVAIGRMFFGESMFARRSDASKIALAALVAWCRAHDVPLIDCQQETLHLASMGARPIPRAAFEAHLEQVLQSADRDDWTYDPSLWDELLRAGHGGGSEPRDDP